MMTTEQTDTRERAELVESLATQRAFLRQTVQGLTDEQSSRCTTASTLCLAGVIKHVSFVELGWAEFMARGPEAIGGMDAAAMQAHTDSFRMLEGETLAGLLDQYDEVARHTEEVVDSLSSLDSSHPLPRGAVVRGGRPVVRSPRPAAHPGRDGTARRPCRHHPGVARRSQDHGLTAAALTCQAVADRTPVIAGIGLSDYPRAPHLDGLGHHAQALQRALADCGLSKEELDGYTGAGMGAEAAPALAEYLGIDHRFIDGTMTGGSSFEFHVQHAAAAIRDGTCDAVAVTYGSNFLTARGRSLGTGGFLGAGQKVFGVAQYEAPYGGTLVGNYAMAARRHMYEFGTTSEQLAEIAVGVREFAGLNPLAMYRDPMTVADVLDSRMIADPLHKLDCCVVSDGGGAVILTTAERARDLRQPPVYVLGAAGGQTHWNIGQMPDFTTTAAATCGPDALGPGGLTGRRHRHFAVV